MTALNHAALGTIIALTIHQPLLAVPLAFLSHFVLDTIPHYSSRAQFGYNTVGYYVPIVLDLTLAVIFAKYLTTAFPDHAGLIIACIVAATGPDYLWPFRDTKYGQKYLGWFYRFHQGIQKSETTKGILVEIPWFALSCFVISRL